MKIISSLLIATACWCSCIAQTDANKLWYTTPAAEWTDALPVGNGRIGAMVFGRVGNELIQLNESSLWTGGPVKTNINPEAPSFLPGLRDALFAEDYDKATALAHKMQGLYTESYLPLGDLMIGQDFNNAQPTHYYRDLNLANAITTTSFTINGVSYTREVFVSSPDRVLVVRLSASKPGKLSFDVKISSQLHSKVLTGENNELIMKGKAPAHANPDYYNPEHAEPIIYTDTAGCNGMRFQVRVRALHKDGLVKSDATGIHVSNATEVILLMAAATSFNGFDKCPDKDGLDENLLAQQMINRASEKTYPQLLKGHLADFRSYFNRVSFTIKDTTGNNTDLPTDQRLKAYAHGAYDPRLETLFFQFGRYLLISGSRPGGPAANLQGIWNKELRAPWCSNYTLDINTQMNYWPAEVTNLSEMHLPLMELIKNISVTGAATAKEFYNMDGWVAHSNSDLWALSNPTGDRGHGDPQWANWTQGGNWLCQHLWEHYRFTGNKKFLNDTAYPIMKQAAVFTLQWLMTDKNGWLVTVPSVSPENAFYYAPGKASQISIATTMDMSVIYDLFSNIIDASDDLGIDKDFNKLIRSKRSKLLPMQIGHAGNLQEWYKDYEDTDPHHRHTSHLFGLFPGRQISPMLNPKLAEAAKKTLVIRGDESTGWSKAWKINFWARLLDGDHAYLLLRDLLTYVVEHKTGYSGGGVYANLFDAHPPFQVDGNFGATAGMTEMLVQSQLGKIALLPALPVAWKEGAVSGLKARGNFEVAIAWRDHHLATATLRAINGGVCRVTALTPFAIDGIGTSTEKSSEGYYEFSFQCRKGEWFHITGR